MINQFKKDAADLLETLNEESIDDYGYYSIDREHLKSIIEEYDGEPESEGKHLFNAISDFLNTYPDFKELVHIEACGGEGKGDTYYSIFKAEYEGEYFYIKLDGWYASHLGGEYERAFIVTPRNTIVVVYDEVK